MTDTPSFTDVLEGFVDVKLRGVRTAIPARVKSFDAANQTIEAEPMVHSVLTDPDGNTFTTTDPVLPKVRVQYQRGGGYFMAFPLQPGDFVWLMCCDRSIESWLATGQLSEPEDGRHHDLSDAFAIPGAFPEGAELQDANGENLVIGKDGEGPLLTMKPDGSILIGREAAKAAARVDDPVEVEIPAGTFVEDVVGQATGKKNLSPVKLEGRITAGSDKVKLL